MLDMMMYPDEQPRMLQIVADLPDGATMLEYGSGGSTIRFAQTMRKGQTLYSVEHNADWFQKVGDAFKELDKHDATVYRKLIKLPNVEHYTRAFATTGEELPAQCEKYIHPEFKQPIFWDSLSLVLVDGIARGACLAAVRSMLMPGTKVILHDYTGRENWYDWAVQLYHRENLTNMLLELRVP